MANRQRLFSKMEQVKLDALVVFKPENFFYMTGYKPHMGGEITIAPRHAAAMTVVPMNDFESSTAIINEWEKVPATTAAHNHGIRDVRTFPVWIEIFDQKDLQEGKTKRIEKPVQYDIGHNIRMLGEALREKKLEAGRIGVELDFISAQVYTLLKEELPQMTLVDSSRLLHDIQAVKTEEEVEIIKLGTQMAQRGMLAVAKEGVLGKTVDEVKMIYQDYVMQEAYKDPSLGYRGYKVTMSIGGDFAPKTGVEPYRAVKGDIVFFDPGVDIKGYRSDIGRSMIIGKPNDFQKRIIGALRAGIEKMYSMIKPGVSCAELFNAGQETVRKSGIDSYTRGHLGHAVGLGKGERPPFIASSDETVLEKGMVMCVETPLYIHGAGGFQIEDTVVVTEDGYEMFTDLPKDLIEVN